MSANRARFKELNRQAVAAVDAKDFELADELIAEGASAPRVMARCAQHGFHEQVEMRLAANPLLIDAAVRGYALSQDVVRAETVIARGGVRSAAVRAYAEVMRVDLVEFQSHTPDISFEHDVLDVYEKKSHLQSGVKVLRILAGTNSDIRRREIEQRARRHLFAKDRVSLFPKCMSKVEEMDLGLRVEIAGARGFDATIMQDKAKVVCQIMLKHELDLDTAAVLMCNNITGALVWLLQGNCGIMPYEIFLNISSYVFGLSDSQTRKLYAFISRNTYEGAREKIEINEKPYAVTLFVNSCVPTLFAESVARYNQKISELESKYDEVDCRHGQRK
jgi:hypothetical protein